MSERTTLLEYAEPSARPPRPRRLRGVLIGVGIVVLLVVAGGRYGLRYLMLGRWTVPTASEYAAIAQKHQSVVQAIRDYRVEHGMLPERMEDLVPAYLSRVPAGPWPTFEGNRLSIHAGVPHTYVFYAFDAAGEGWYAGGDFGTGRLPVPPPATTRPAPSGEALVAARLAEYDRRIIAATADQRDGGYSLRRNHKQKIAYLVSLEKHAEALGACRAAASALPDWWRPRVSAAVLAATPEAEQELQAWVAQYPTFIHYWYLYRYYRDRGRHVEAVAALREAVKHSLAVRDPDGQWVPDAHAFDAAAYACARREPELVLQITDVWEKPRGDYDYHNDNLHAFRAAAELALGRFDEAQPDLDRVVAAGKTTGLWAGNLDALGRALTARDQTFVYDPGKLPNDWRWFPQPE